MMQLTSVLFAVVLSLSACTAAPKTGEPLTGAWGGAHISLQLDESGGVLEYDCAAGSIDEPVRLDASGRFSARGTHTPNTGGPERVDVERPRVPAEYSGQITGTRMTLSVRAPQELGPFTLSRGGSAQLMRCL